ncbi:MAG: SDR family oxidoreductase, partial [Mesorhizobium sp.]
GAGSVGGGWGNGKATAVLMARQGAKVFGTDINPEALTDTGSAMARENLSGRWTSCQCDATSGASVEAAVARCVQEFGRIDILVNNVGGSAPGDPITMSEEVWQKQISLNLDSVFLNCKHVLPVM